MVKVLPSCRVMLSMEKYSTLRLLLPPSLLSSSSSSSSSMLMSIPPRLLVTCTKPCREQQWFQKKNDSLSSTKMNVFKRMFQKHECSKTWIITSKGISTSICEKWLWKVMYIWSPSYLCFSINCTIGRRRTQMRVEWCERRHWPIQCHCRCVLFWFLWIF